MKDKLSDLPESLNAFKEYALSVVDELPSKEEDGALLIGNDTSVAPLYYKAILWPSIDRHSIARYEQIHEIEFPGKLREFLSTANGLKVLGLHLFGISKSMLGDPPTIDRTTKNTCMDIIVNRKPGMYKRGYFVFASRHWSYSENVDYCITPNEEIVAFLKNGKEVGHWCDFSSFLFDAIEGAKEYEANPKEVNKKPWWKIW